MDNYASECSPIDEIFRGATLKKSPVSVASQSGVMNIPISVATRSGVMIIPCLLMYIATQKGDFGAQKKIAFSCHYR